MTRTLSALTAAGLLVAATGCSPAAEAPPVDASPAAATFEPASEVEPVIVQLEHDWVDAIVKKDAARLERLLAEDFVGTSPTAHTYTKQMALNDLESGTYVVKSMNLDDVSANIYGDTAVAFTSQEEESSYGGKASGGHYHYTNVWARKNGEWRVVASHGSRYAQAH